MSIKEEKIHGFSALMHLAERICGVKHKRFLLAPRVCPGRIYRFSPSAIYAPRTFVRSKSVGLLGVAPADPILNHALVFRMEQLEELSVLRAKGEVVLFHVPIGTH